LTVRQPNRANTIAVNDKVVHAAAEHRLHVMARQSRFDLPRHLDIQRREHLRLLLDKRDRQAPFDERFNHLQPNKARTDHDGFGWALCLDKTLDRVHVRHVAQRENVLAIHAVPWRYDRRGARC